MTITIRIEGARPDEIVRGLLAAQEVFDRAGVSADDAATARFVVEGWDIRGFTGEVPEAELGICDLWDEADQAALEACCRGLPQERIPRTAQLELVTEPVPFRLAPLQDVDVDQLFEAAEEEILAEMCREGYFAEGGPEDEVAGLLLFWDFEWLTEDQRRLYSERIRPLMRIWFFQRGCFNDEYRKRRAEWRGAPRDDRQLALFR